MLESGYIKLFRSLLAWEWYDDSNTFRVFLHLILTANWYENEWHGIPVKRGQRICSYAVLAKELKLSEKNVRTAVKHLKQTGEVAHTATPQYGIFAVLNYDKFQELAPGAADSGHPEGTQAAPDGHLIKNDKKAIMQENDNLYAAKPEKSMRLRSPTVDEIATYCTERKNSVDPQRFFDYYESNGWMVGRSKMKDWKAAVRTWEKNTRSAAEHPDYSDPSRYADEQTDEISWMKG